MYYVYVLKSTIKPWRYTGSTGDIKQRLAEHNTGQSRATRPYAPFQLIYLEKYASRPEAIRRELYFKTGKGREDLDRMIN
ncbi:GIY-YIG nuclease family protein [Candidatus Saccharibacteria bacterium]|nr:GIY-YIG nuclease family protein [Candidatus Saccharibacteria bacterium]